jgi:hypothetical protein
MRTKEGVIACAIVKNEPRFSETVNSLREAVGPALRGIVIHDTGSDRVDALAALSDLDGGDVIVYSRPFDDFASARNACLDDACKRAAKRGAPWLFMFSAGAKFSGSWKGAAGPAMRHTEVLGDAEFSKVCAIRAGSSLRFAGRTHESIDVSPLAVEDLPHCGLTVDYTADWDPAKKRDRWLLDIELLKDDYSPRGRFYLAQSFKCLGMYHEAFCYYLARLEMSGYEPERLQAAREAVVTAPTITSARFAARYAPDCADVQLALAERELTERNYHETRKAAVLASALETRSMFQDRNLQTRCAEISARVGEIEE